MLSAAERRQLQARAHRLEPVVVIGTKGLTDEVVKEVDVALKAHELVKVRAAGLEREQRDDALRQSIGKVFVIYRKRDE
jgi:RNA-binding protein